MMMKAIVSLQAAELKPFTQKYFSELHAKQQSSLCNAVAGVIESNSLMVTKIGEGLAKRKGLKSKHAIKQVDRLLSNDNFDPVFMQNRLATFLIKNRSRIYVAIDWTVFAKDSQMTVCLRLITTHGRATPLLWQTVSTVDLKGKKNDYVFAILERLRILVPKCCDVVLLGDREFGTLNMFEKVHKTLGFHYILRIKRNFTVTTKDGKKCLAHECIKGEETICHDDAKLTVKDYSIKKVIVSKQPKMKDMWCLASSLHNIATQTILNLYGKRWGIETSFRDEKDLQFGLGLKKSRIKSCTRRDRLFLISAIAIIFLTILGAASEKSGYDRYLKANTEKKRTHSLFNQGKAIFSLYAKLETGWRKRIYQAISEISTCIPIGHTEPFVI